MSDFTFTIVEQPLTVTLADPSPVVLELPTQQGPAGAPGGGGQYTHTQASPASEWTVNHNLGFRPNVAVMTNGGVEVMAEVLHFSINQARVYMDTPMAGIAVCS